MCLPLVLLSACDVHEWPDLPDNVQFTLKLRYEPDMTYWNHVYDGTDVNETGEGATYDNRRLQGSIRYTVRAFPAGTMQRAASMFVREFTFTKNISEGYDHEVALALPPGEYDLMVWSDLTETSGDTPFYDVTDFAGIELHGDHVGNNDYRDAFRGYTTIALSADVAERLPQSYEIAMERPLAKYEFIANDVAEFIRHEYARRSREAEEADVLADGDKVPVRVNVEDYRVVFYYVGFMPCSFGMHVDKPVDSSTGVMFESTLKKLNEDEATMGFDYVLVNGKETAVTVRMGLYDTDGNMLSVTGPVDVPLKRSRHTVVRGRFLTTDAGGGIGIDPGYNGDFNIVF